VARELDAIDRKLLPAEQALLVTDDEDRGEDVGDVRAQRTDELRYGRGAAVVTIRVTSYALPSSCASQDA